MAAPAMNPRLRVSTGLSSLRRVPRRPEHTFQLRVRPWQIQPCFIMPVLPGETMTNLLVQIRAVSDPVKNPLIGWWFEWYCFYVKHRDLDERDSLVDMVLDPNYNAAALQEAAITEYYHAANSIAWVKKCSKRIIEEYFRDEDEAWNIATLGNVPLASIAQQSWLDSAINDDDFVAEDVGVVVGVDDTVTAREMDDAMRQWQLLRFNNLTEQSYEDWLASYGVKPQQAELHRPELVRYVREWTYPTSVVEPTTGVPSAAVSWKIAERADKDRFFAEPGFLVGLVVVRPKVYRQPQAGSVVDWLDDAWSWLPAVLDDDPRTSMRRFVAGTGPLPGNTDDYWIDAKDLFLYGDQFLNFAATDTAGNIISLPTAGLAKKYAASADADELFAAIAPANQIRMDGIASVTILGRQRDTSPRVS